MFILFYSFISFAVIPSFPQGFILLLSLELTSTKLQLMSFLLVFLKHIDIQLSSAVSYQKWKSLFV